MTVRRTQPTLTELADAIRSGRTSSVEVVEEALDQIRQKDSSLHAFITCTADSARQRASEVDRELSEGRYRGPLHGVPFSVKDVFMTEGVPTTAGSRLLAGRIFDRTARCVTQLLDAGAVLIGKTNTHEFHAGATNENELFGQCRNPARSDRISGGSSGGSAVSVAAGMAVFSLGADTGGSIRIPSALCGVVGFKPSFGRVSPQGMITESWSCDHVGPIVRSVSDCAPVMSVLDPAGSWSRADEMGRADRITIGIPPDAVLGDVTPGVAAAFHRALAALQQAGATLASVPWPEAELVSDVLQVIIWSEAAEYHREGLESSGNQYSAEVRRKFTAASVLSCVDYVHAQRVRTQIAMTVAEAHKSADIILMPTVPSEAPTPGRSILLNGSVREIERVLARLTPVANLVGAPALAVPCGLGADQLPVSVMLQGKRGQDEILLAVGSRLEDALEL